MSETRVRLAQMVGDELSGDVSTIVNDTMPIDNAPGVEPGADGEPRLTEAVRALLIMLGCEATFARNHWVVRKAKISVDEENAWARATMQNRKKFRIQTALPIHATFEDWREAVNFLMGDTVKP